MTSDFAPSSPGVSSPAEVGVARATALFERMRVAEAVAALEPVLATAPSADGWNLMARLRLALDQPSAALQAANEALALAPDDPRAPATASRALSLLGRHDEAVTMAYRAVAADPKNPLWHDRAAWALIAAGRHLPDAEQAARTAIGLDPDEPHYYFTHGVTLEALGHVDQARQALLTTLRMQPENPAARHRLAVLDGEAAPDPEPRKKGLRLFGRKKN